MSTPKYTIARRICGWCKTTLGVELWRYCADYGPSTETHGLCEKCFDECFEPELGDLAEAS